MYGILILSIVFAQEGRLLLSGLSFAALLCMKHIYLYLAPAYFVYLLRAYCLSPNWSLYPTTIFRIQFFNCIKLGLGIAAIFAAAFSPFVYWEQLPQLMSRLFPFSRGLCHAYWAPNVWAMYSFTDRILIYCKYLYILAPDISRPDIDSGALLQSACQPRCHQQRHPRPSRRHCIRSTSRDHASTHIHPDDRNSDTGSTQALLSTIIP